MKKVLIFGLTDNPGGVEAVIMNYYRHFDAKKIQCDFLCNTEKVVFEDEIEKNGGRVFRVTARSKDPIRYRKELNAFFERYSKEYDVFWMNVCSLANIDYLKKAKQYGIKRIIIHGHNSKNMDSFFRGLLHRVNKMFIKRYATDFWICSYDSLDWFYPKSIKVRKEYSIINNAIDYDTYRFRSDIRAQYRLKEKCNNKVIIGNVGRLHFQKNQKFCIEVFRELSKICPDVKLWLIGDGPDKKDLKKKVLKYGLQKDVRFFGARNDIPELLQAMDIFLFPSVFEGLGVAHVEAQCAGLPTFVAEGVMPAESRISDDFIEISLKKSAKQWAEEIYNFYNENSNRSRLISKDALKAANLDIVYESKKVEAKLYV